MQTQSEPELTQVPEQQSVGSEEIFVPAPRPAPRQQVLFARHPEPTKQQSAPTVQGAPSPPEQQVCGDAAIHMPLAH